MKAVAAVEAAPDEVDRLKPVCADEVDADKKGARRLKLAEAVEAVMSADE